MVRQVCPRCGQPIRSAKGCPCGTGSESHAEPPPKRVAAGGDYAAWRAEQPEASWDQPALDAAIERRFRQFALPVALLLAWAVVHAGFLHSLLRIVLSMWIHELGHAVAAWLCGRFAFPGPWFTPVGAQRSWVVALVVAVVVAIGIQRLWRRHKVGAGALALVFVAQAICTLGLSERQAMSFIIWSGDGGCMLLGSLLMLSLYARKHSQIRVGWLRWGFLVIGAAAFADGFATWWAARTDPEAIPFGENEGQGQSDPTVLVFQYGWSLKGMVWSYLWVGFACLALLLLAYVLGLRREREIDEEGAA
jgi:hypothetical protein